MAKRNDFMEGFLRGLYNSGVGNPEVQRTNEQAQQTQNADFTTKMAGQGMIPNQLPSDHPISQKVGGFISQLMGGASSPKLLASSFKPDPNAITQDATGKLGMGNVGTPGVKAVPADKGPTLLAEQYRKGMTSTAVGGNITWDTATPEQQRMAKAVYDGNVDVSRMGFRERTAINFLANEYANNNGLAPYKSYLTETHARTANQFTSGKFGQNINALNTALGHVESVHQAYQDIGNTDQRWLNTPINKLKEETKDPKIIKLGISLNALKGELATVFKGSSGTDMDAKSWSDYLSEDLTPQQAYGAMTEVDDLLRSRQSALEYQRGGGMGQNPGTNPLISPKASKTRDSLSTSPLKPKNPVSPAGWEADKEKRYQEWKAKQ